MYVSVNKYVCKCKKNIFHDESEKVVGDHFPVYNPARPPTPPKKFLLNLKFVVISSILHASKFPPLKPPEKLLLCPLLSLSFFQCCNICTRLLSLNSVHE